jgi:hypothetical protein
MKIRTSIKAGPGAPAPLATATAVRLTSFHFSSCRWPYVCHPDVPLPARDTSKRVERGGSHGAIECATSPGASG